MKESKDMRVLLFSLSGYNKDVKLTILPGTNRPHTLKYGNSAHGIVYNQMRITINTAFVMVSFPSSGLAIT